MTAFPFEFEYPWLSRRFRAMSRITSCGALNPNGAGFPIFSFRTSIPSSTMRSASSTTGPLTSYNTLSSLEDLLNLLMKCLRIPPSVRLLRRLPGCAFINVITLLPLRQEIFQIRRGMFIENSVMFTERSQLGYSCYIYLSDYLIVDEAGEMLHHLFFFISA